MLARREDLVLHDFDEALMITCRSAAWLIVT
jgi:hypothetical protein